MPAGWFFWLFTFSCGIWTPHPTLLVTFPLRRTEASGNCLLVGYWQDWATAAQRDWPEIVYAKQGRGHAENREARKERLREGEDGTYNKAVSGTPPAGTESAARGDEPGFLHISL